jgi:hypothetical protein
MILWDIVIKYNPYSETAKLAMKIPNGDPLPESVGDAYWIREQTAISGDEAEYQLSSTYAHITQPKC